MVKIAALEDNESALQFFMQQTIKIDPVSGLLTPAHFLLSPNHDERPRGQEIDLLVIHNISLPPGQFGGGEVAAFFTNQLDPARHEYFQTIAHLKVSSHLFIARNGHTTQFVPLTKRAWHAGQSFFKGREKCNDFSIGIELEGTDDLAYTSQQYLQLTQVTYAIMRAYPKITLQDIVGHSDIAPGRKTDPGPAFAWDRFRQMINQRFVDKQESQKTNI